MKKLLSRKTGQNEHELLCDLLGHPSKLYWLNIKIGFVRGMAGVIGAAVMLILLGVLVTSLGGIPVIGAILQKLTEATTIK